MKNKIVFLLIFIILSLSIFISIPIVKTDGENWLGDWYYRKNHIINNATNAGTLYQIQIYVWNSTGTDNGNNVTLGNHVLSNNFGDIRVTDNDGSTLLDYWVQSINSTTAIFWVEIADSLEISAQTIYIYYGKTSTITTSNGINTFLFFDDFNVDLNKWKQNLATWTLTTDSGNSVVSAPITPNGASLLTNQTTVGNARIRANIRRAISNAEYPYIVIRDPINTNWDTCYDLYQSETTTISQFMMEERTPYSNLINLANSMFCKTDYYIMDFSAYGSSLKGTIMNTTHTYQISATDTTKTSGYFGFFVWSVGTNVYIDWIFASKYIVSEPTHSTWGTEENRIVYYLNYSDISQNSSMLGTNVIFSVLWTSNGSLIDYTFEWNFTGTMIADSAIEWDNTTSPQWSNITKNLGIDTSKYGYVIQWRINATGNANNSTGIQSFNISAIVINYYVPDTGLLKINSTTISNSTQIYPYCILESESLPNSGFSFYNFTENSVYYNDNPSIITFDITDFFIDYNSNFTMYLSGQISNDEIIIIIVVLAVIFSFVVFMILFNKYPQPQFNEEGYHP